LISSSASDDPASGSAAEDMTEVSKYFSFINTYQSISDILEDGHFNQADLVYPHSGELHKLVPSRVAKIYKEAEHFYRRRHQKVARLSTVGYQFSRRHNHQR
jgi:hypothetical protein